MKMIIDVSCCDFSGLFVSVVDLSIESKVVIADLLGKIYLVKGYVSYFVDSDIRTFSFSSFDVFLDFYLNHLDSIVSVKFLSGGIGDVFVPQEN